MALVRGFIRIAAPTLLVAAVFAAQARAQSPPSAYGPSVALWAGADYSNFTASFPYESGQRITGPTAFADFHFNYRFGLNGEANLLTFGGFEGSTENSYLIGPRAVLFFRGRFVPYGKVLVGDARIHYPFRIGNASYLALAPGAGADYRVSGRWMLRLDYEYQLWLNSPGYANEPKHELTPNGFHVGIAYRVLP
jgi:opacity protein-like surface antigen